MSPTTEDLTRSLREHADRVATAPLGIEDVRRRATRIRRRRHGAALTAVAATVAVAVAVPMSLTGRQHEPVQPAGPAKPVTVTLDPAGAPRGDDPAIPYAVDGEIVAPDGARVRTGGDITAFAPLGSRWVVAGIDENGIGTVRQLDEDGSQLDRVLSDSLILAASADGSIVTFANGGRRHYLVDSGAKLIDGGGDPVTPAGVVATGHCESISSCAIGYWNVDGETPTAVKNLDDTIPGVEEISGVATDGRIAGQVSHTDAGSCSAVLDEDGTQLWRTCDFSLGRFSPDGRTIVAYPAYRDGAGDGFVSVLDSRTGRVLASFMAPGEGFVVDAAWESDDSLIAIVRSDRWDLVRLSTSGKVERAAEPFAGDDPYVGPLVLATRG